MNDSFRGMIRASVWLTFWIALGWVLCFWPARWLRGTEGVVWLSVAAISCLVPGWIVVFLSGLAMFRNELVAMLVQTNVRLMLVAGTALFVRKQWPAVGIVDFFGWLTGFYLLALGVEVYFLRKGSLRQGSGSEA